MSQRVTSNGRRDVVITGIGVVTPIGIGVDAMWDSLMAGRSGVGPLTHFDASNLPVTIAAEASDFDAADYMDRREVGRNDRFTHMAVAAARMAIEDAGTDSLGESPDRVGVIVGSGIGGIGTIEREKELFLERGPRAVSPFTVPKLMPNAAAAAIAMKHGLKGINYAPSSACATGAHAIGEAYRAIKDGIADVMLAGGTEAAITPLSVAAFCRMQALSTRNDDPEHASRPFDAKRNGFVFGEGAGVLVLETRESAENRGAQILCTLAGYGASADAHHVTQPDPEGAGASSAIRRALEDAGVAPDEVDYINAHGTSTPYNDRVETLALKSSFGNEAKRIAVSSTKSQMGHLLGAAGAVEAAICALVIDRGIAPGTVNYEEADPDCDLDYVTEGPRDLDINVAVSNSFGFGGQNAVLAFTNPGWTRR
ncbi:MAG: beta-ketoacyl-ACP synthase II [Actinomycetota bacterium]